jgi:predicted site-specific integrase-resolvase
MLSNGLMTVGDLSRRTGVAVKTLRQYTDWGLIYTVGRSATNYRLFDADACGASPRFVSCGISG